MGNVRTPGVYIVEKNAFPNPVVEVATAVPAFVGWTQCAELKGQSLHLKPHRITSMAEYQQCFGGGPAADHVRFKLAKLSGEPSTGDMTMALAARDAVPLCLGQSVYTITQAGGKYLLYDAMRLFFQNGGGPCYVVSAGEYGSQVNAAQLTAGLQELAKEIEPTMLVIPEAVLLNQMDCLSLQKQMLMHCGQVMKNRVAILDVWEGYRPRSDAPDVVAAFRDGVGKDDLSFGAAYYPWINTGVVQERELSYENMADDESLDTLVSCLKDEIAAAGIEGTQKAAMEAEVDKIKTAPTVPTRAC